MKNLRHRTTSNSRWINLSGAVIIAAALSGPLSAAVVPPEQTVAGRTYSQWAAAWWQWALQIPDDGHHPLKDRTGADALRDQNGSVWFLCATLNGGGATVTRDIVVPDDKTLFLNIVDTECSTVEPPPFHGDNEAELRTCAESFRVAALSCEIDSVPVSDMGSFLGTSPLFDFNLPLNNLLGVIGGGQGQAVAYGCHVMISRLSAGPHTIHFHGSLPDYNITIDVLYHITVLVRPTMTIQPVPGSNLVELSWRSTNVFNVQSADRLDPTPTWIDASVVTSAVVDDQRIVTVAVSATNRFFRLSQP